MQAGEEVTSETWISMANFVGVQHREPTIGCVLAGCCCLEDLQLGLIRDDRQRPVRPEPGAGNVVAHLLPQFAGPKRKAELGARGTPRNPHEARIPHGGPAGLPIALEVDNRSTRTYGEKGVHRAEDPTADHDNSLPVRAHQVTSLRQSTRMATARSRSSRETLRGGESVSTLPMVVLKDSPRPKAA